MLLKGSLRQAGASLVLGDGATTQATLQTSNSAAATLTLPSSTDTLVGRASTDTLTNKTIDGGSNTITGLAYGSVSLTGSIVNADVAAGAAIAYSKLALGGSVVNADIATAAAIAYSKLTLTGSVVNADISGTAAIAYSKLTLTGSVVDADISGTAAIAYSKLNLAGAVKLASDVTGVLPAANGGTGVLSTATFPTAGVIVTEAGSETLTNKTLTAPVISSIVNTGTLTLPTSTDTLLGRATTDTLTNKTLTAPVQSSYEDLTEIATPAAPAASKLRLYAKSDDNLYVQTSAGIEKAVGSGSGGGSGQKNYVSSSASSTWVAASWTAFGTVAGSTDTTAADLPRATTTASGWKLTPSGSVSGTVTLTIATPAVFTATAHGMQTGYPVTFSTTGALPTGLTAGTVYYVNVLSSSTFNVATTMANLLAGTYVATSGTQSGTQSFTFGGAYTRFTLDAADYNVKQQVQHAQNILSGATGDWGVDVYSNTASDYSGTYTRLPLSTDSAGSTALTNLEGTFRTTFDAPGSAAQYIELRFSKLAANTHALVGSDLVVGPGVVVQGAAVSGWQSWTPTFTNVTLGTGGTATAYYRRVGESAQIRVQFTLGSSGQSVGNYIQLPLPSGLTLNAAAVPTFSALGTAWGNPAGAQWGGAVRNDGAGLLFAVNSSTASNPWGTSTPGTWAAGNIFGADYTVPIAEWAGSGTVNVAQNDVAYYYFTGVTWGTTNTSATIAQGPGGALGGTTTPTGTAFEWAGTPSTPVPVGSKPELELSPDGVHWMTPSAATGASFIAIDNARNDGTNYIGAQAYITSAGTVGVLFGKYASGTGAIWTSTWYYRIKVASPGAAVGFGIVNPGVASGLVSAAGVPGNTTGNAIASGYVGEKLETTTINTVNVTTAGINASVLTLTAGTWSVTGSVYVTANGTTNGGAYFASTSLVSGTNDVNYMNYQGVGAGAAGLVFPTRIITTTGTAIYGTVTANSISGGPPTISNARLTAVRIA